MYQIAPEGVLELTLFCGHFSTACKRIEVWQALEDYLKGLLLPIPRKNCDQMAAAIPGCHPQRLQHLLTDGIWDEQAVNQKRLDLFQERFGQKPGYLILDDTGIPKKGKASVGVARQYSGTLGKIGNCQVVVTSQFVTPEGVSCPVSARLYLPEAWTATPDRCRRVHVPEDVAFQTKPQIAVDLVDEALAAGFSCRAVLGDAAYGRQTDLLEALEERDLPYVLTVGRDFSVRREADVERAKQRLAAQQAAQRTGRPRTRLTAKAITAEALTAKVPKSEWRSITVRQGQPGALTKSYCRLPVYWGNKSRVGSKVWLIAERPLPGDDGEPKWYVSSLQEATLEEQVEIAHQRWHIERYYQDAKTELGFDHYEGRSWIGLHRHLTLVMLAYTWLLLSKPEKGEPPLSTEPDLFMQAYPTEAEDIPRFAFVRYVRRWALSKFQESLCDWYVLLINSLSRMRLFGI